MKEIQGNPPSIEWRDTDSLRIDQTYQRMTKGKASQKLIKEIAENFDWRLCPPLVVSSRNWSDDPGDYVIDGQHRQLAALTRGDIPRLPCMVTDFGSIEAEALYFVAINSNRQQVTAIDKYHARVAAKEPLALRIRSLLIRAGLAAARHADPELWETREIGFPDHVGAADTQSGDEKTVGALRLLLACYPNTVLVHGRAIFDGLRIVLQGSVEDGLDPRNVLQAFAAHVAQKRQSVWKRAADKMAAELEIPTQRAMAQVLVKGFEGGLSLDKRKHDGKLARFKTPKPGGGVDLPDTHEALVKTQTLFPSTVRQASSGTKVFKSGHNSAKIGALVTKGRWKGMPIFTLTLQERDTCPDTCLQKNDCYGNNMPFAHRFDKGPELEAAIMRELDDMAQEHPEGFVVRLHALGDFYSAQYALLWSIMVDKHPMLHIFGYTAHSPDEGIGEELLGMMLSNPERIAIRFSGGQSVHEMEDWSAEVIDGPEGAEKYEKAFICPGQTGQVETCGSCTLCWERDGTVLFLNHKKKETP